MSTISKNRLLKWCITTVVFAAIMLIPATVGFTSQIRLFLAGTSFCILMIAFELTLSLLVAIAIPTFYTISGLAPIATAFSPYSGVFLWMVLGAFVLGNVMDETGLLKRIAYRFIMLMGGSFSGAVYGAFIVSAFINLVTFGNAWVIALPVIMGIIKALELKPGKESAIVCFAGMAGTVDSGVMMYIPSSIVMIETHIQTVIPGFRCSVVSCLAYNFMILIISIGAIAIVLWNYNRDSTKNGAVSQIGDATKEYFGVMYKEMGRISSDEIKSLIIFLLLLGYTIACTFTGWNSAYGFMVIPYLAFLPMLGCGAKAESAIKKINFTGLFFAASCVTIGVVGNLIGFNSWLASAVIPIVSGKGLLFTCILLLLITVVGNFVLTPGALMAGFGGSYASIAAAVGMKPMAALMILFFSGNIVFLPHEVAGYLLLYGMGYWPIKEFVKQQSLKACVYFVVFIIIMYPLWQMTGLL